MSLNTRLQALRRAVQAYFTGGRVSGDEPLPEVNKALVEDAPRVVRLTIWSLVGFFLFALLWAGFAQVDEVTRGEGKVIPSRQVQVMQSLDGGIVSEILVKEGQQVNEGDKIAELEAMKMKVPVTATCSGTVSAIHVAVGDAVEGGQALLTIA